MNRRLALVTGLTLLLGAVLFTALPANVSNTECGWWVAPEWSESESRELGERYLAVAEEASTMEGGGELFEQSGAQAMKVANSYRACTDKLSTRRNLTLGLLASAVLVPAGILYVGRRED